MLQEIFVKQKTNLLKNMLMVQVKIQEIILKVYAQRKNHLPCICVTEISIYIAARVPPEISYFSSPTHFHLLLLSLSLIATTRTRIY